MNIRQTDRNKWEEVFISHTISPNTGRRTRSTINYGTK